MADLFEEISINSMPLKNRSVRSATWAGMAEHGGRCSHEHGAKPVSCRLHQEPEKITSFFFFKLIGMVYKNDTIINYDPGKHHQAYQGAHTY